MESHLSTKFLDISQLSVYLDKLQLLFFVSFILFNVLNNFDCMPLLVSKLQKLFEERIYISKNLQTVSYSKYSQDIQRKFIIFS